MWTSIMFEMITHPMVGGSLYGGTTIRMNLDELGKARY